MIPNYKDLKVFIQQKHAKDQTISLEIKLEDGSLLLANPDNYNNVEDIKSYFKYLNFLEIKEFKLKDDNIKFLSFPYKEL